MASDPLNDQRIAAFPAGKLPAFLRAVVDPEGRGRLEPEDDRALAQVEANVGRAEAAPERDA